MNKLAEGVGFEPTGDSRRRRFSRPVLSTAQPPLRDAVWADYIIRKADARL